MNISEFSSSVSPSPTSANRTLAPSSPSPASSSSSMRLWRPAAQWNLRNQWSKLSNCRKQWITACSSGRSYATSLVNSYLSQKYMPMMELGVLSDMFDIKKKALKKLFKQQSSYGIQLLSSYKEMEDLKDAGDYDGISVFNFWNLSAFEQMAEELVEMFKCELMLKSLSQFFPESKQIIREFLLCQIPTSQPQKFCRFT